MSQKSSLLVRVDAGANIGIGHVMRCLALAQAWLKAGGTATFLSCEFPKNLEERLELEGIGLIRLKVSPGGQADAEKTVDFAERFGISWIILDGYNFDYAYQHRLMEANMRVLFIDDCGNEESYLADVLLNQNLNVDSSLYAKRATAVTLLLGSRFVLLRKEFIKQVRVKPQTITHAKHILVTFGGADERGCTIKVIRALAKLKSADLSVTVAVGASNQHIEELQTVVDESKLRLALLENVADMSALMARSDLAITAGGSTCWELAYMGVPSVIIIQAENQVRVAKALEEAGAAVNLGWFDQVSIQVIAESINHLISNEASLLELSKRGRNLIDGRGCESVVSELTRDRVRLRAAKIEDMELFWEWANDTSVRELSFMTESIPWEDHRVWFENKLKDPATDIYVALDDARRPIGQVRFDCDNHESIVSVSLDSSVRGQGLGSLLIESSCTTYTSHYTERALHAYIRPENVVSKKAFTKAGFKQVEETRNGNVLSLHYVFTKKVDDVK